MSDTPKPAPAADPNLIFEKTRVIDDVGDLVIHRSQVIPQSYKDELKYKQQNFRWNLDGLTELFQVGEVTANRWMRQDGFDVMTAPFSEIIARLKREEKDMFVTMGNRKL